MRNNVLGCGVIENVDLNMESEEPAPEEIACL